MTEIGSLIPTLAELQHRVNRPQEVQPSAQSIAEMQSVFAKVGYTKENIQVYNALIEYGARKLDNSNFKGLFLKGDVGIGKSFGAEILAWYFKIPVIRPDVILSRYKDFNGNLLQLEYNLILSGAGGMGYPCDIVLDELGKNDDARNFGESVSLMAEVLDMRYRAFIRHGVKTIVTTNLTDTELKQRYGLRIDDRLNEMFYFRSVTGKSLRK